MSSTLLEQTRSLHEDLEVLERAKHQAAEATGISVWNRLRGAGHTNGSSRYFEWSLGSCNMAIGDDEVERAWRAFLQELRSLEEEAAASSGGVGEEQRGAKKARR